MDPKDQGAATPSTGTDLPSPAPAGSTPPSPTGSGEQSSWLRAPAVEIELVHERKAPPYVDRPWHMLEVWTQNRVYSVDATMRCIDVVDQATQQSVPKHGLLGARLVGGQHQEGDKTHLSHPFPRPGTEAVFEQAAGTISSFSYSSTVTRVILRLRLITIGPGGQVPTWDEIVGDATAPLPDE
jgi:hypothetical protein